MLGTITITASSGDYDIIDSGTVISFGGESVIFRLPDNLIIRFAFLTDDSNNTHSIQYHQHSETDLEVRLFNFNNPLGTGNIEPIHIGNINNRPLFLNVRVHFLNASLSRTIHYTWYLQRQV